MFLLLFVCMVSIKRFDLDWIFNVLWFNVYKLFFIKVFLVLEIRKKYLICVYKFMSWYFMYELIGVVLFI